MNLKITKFVAAIAALSLFLGSPSPVEGQDQGKKGQKKPPPQVVAPKFPSFKATRQEKKWIAREIKLTSYRPTTAKFWASLERHEKYLKKKKSPAVKNNYYQTMFRFANFRRDKEPDKAVNLLYNILRREKAGSWYYVEALKHMVKIWYRTAETAKSRDVKKKYYFKIAFPLIYPRKYNVLFLEHKKSLEKLAFLLFEEGEEKLREGIRTDDFLLRRDGEKSWIAISQILPSPNHPFRKFIDACLRYFNVEGCYEMGDKELALAEIIRMEKEVRKWKPKNIRFGQMYFFIKILQMKKELRQSGIKPR